MLRSPNVTIDYEIWNEPNTEAFCLTPDQRMAAYMKLYAAAAPVMKAKSKPITRALMRGLEAQARPASSLPG